MTATGTIAARRAAQRRVFCDVAAENRRRQRVEGKLHTRARGDETQRVIELPEYTPRKLDPVADLGWQGTGPELWDSQLQMLATIQDGDGGMVGAGVGHGKTYVAYLAGTVLGCERVVILAPAPSMHQMHDAHAQLDGHYKLPRIATMTYGKLSHRSGEEALRAALGDTPAHLTAVIADEGHYLKTKTSARTRRIMRLFRDRPLTKLVALSGTMVTHGLDDIAHLAELALRGYSPVPRSSKHLRRWRIIFDVADVRGADGEAEAPRDLPKSLWMRMTPLWRRTGRTDTPLGEADLSQRRKLLRRGLADRWQHTAGMYFSRAASVGASLILDAWDFQPSAKLAATIAGDSDVETWETPDVAEPLEVWRLGQQLSKGFYYRWVWPDGKPDIDWLEARSLWGRFCRRELRYRARRGYDSPMLVASEISRQYQRGGRKEIHRAWGAWAAQKHKPRPPTEAVWLTMEVVDAAVDWLARQKDNAILWYSDRCVADALEERGVKVYRAGDVVAPQGEPVALSADAHRKSLNLQAYGCQLLLGWPSTGARGVEQLLGRTHRRRQMRYEVHATLAMFSEPLARPYTKLVEQARGLQDLTGNAQKLVFATKTAAVAASAAFN